MRDRAARVWLLILAPLALLVVAAAALLGPTRLPWSDVFDPALSSPFWTLRAPRTLLAALAGAGLALGGVIFQALFRNPLATPYTLGIASGASLGAAIGLLLGVSGSLLGLIPTIPALAILGAMTALTAVVLVARSPAGRDLARLLLAGVCVAYLCSAGILLVTYLADQAVTNEIVIWLMGSLARLYPYAPLQVAVVLLPALAFALRHHRALDLLALGDQLAASRGVAVGRVVTALLVLSGLLTAVIVAHCGPIGFVGLMIPHMVRALLGERTWSLLLGSALVGAAFLALCDGLARSLTNYDLPVGILTNILGAAFFFFLLAARSPGAIRTSQ